MIAANDKEERRRLRKLKEQAEAASTEGAGWGGGDDADGDDAASDAGVQGQGAGKVKESHASPKYQNAPQRWSVGGGGAIGDGREGKGGGEAYRWGGGLKLPWLGRLERKKEVSADEMMQEVLGLDKIQPVVERTEIQVVAQNQAPLLAPPNTRNGGLLDFIDSCLAGEVIAPRVPAPVVSFPIAPSLFLATECCSSSSLSKGAVVLGGCQVN